MVNEEWAKGPITELREIGAKEDCDQTNLEKAITDAGATVSGMIEDGTYDTVGQGYWWGIEMGCVCPNGCAFANAEKLYCTDNMTYVGCYNIPATEPITKFPVVNNKKLCAFRDNSYNFLTQVKPVKQGTKWVCSNTTYPTLCGSDSDTKDHVRCIKSTSKCPITSVSYDSSGSV